MKIVSTCNLLFMLLAAVHGVHFNVSKHIYDWGYSGIIGPNTWETHFPYCKGQAQSPINIVYNQVQHDKKFKPLKISNFEQTVTGDCILENNGHSIEVYIPKMANIPTLHDYDGQVYECLGFHFHWGSIDSQGSETWLNNKQYPIEVHVVFYNKKFGALEIAAFESGGLAVISTLLHVGKHNPAFDPIVNNMDKVRYHEQEHTITNINLRSFVAESLSEYFIFNGSLTTPPCTENVVWHVMAGGLSISEEQLNAFRNVYSTESSAVANSAKLVDNYRPLQQLHHRVVYSSFDVSKHTGASVGLYRSWIFNLISMTVMMLTMNMVL